MLVFEAQAEEHAAGEQESWLVPIDGPQKEVGSSHPEQRLERIHGEPGGVAEDHRSKQDGKTGQKYSEAFAAEFAGNKAGDEDLPALGECWQESQGVQRITERYTANARKESNERGEVDVAPGEMVAACEEIEFVAEIAVAGVGKHLQQDCGGCEKPCDGKIAGEESVRIGVRGAGLSRRGHLGFVL